jgi:predicted PhzF superfamily epimerase YddE/YHI9
MSQKCCDDCKVHYKLAMGGALEGAMRVASQIWQVVFASQTLQVFCLAFRKKAQYVVVTAAGHCLVELSSADHVKGLEVRSDEVVTSGCFGMIITASCSSAKDSHYDFVSRFFCPKFLINEDPVCGSAHCALAPYWAAKLGRQQLRAYQA